MTEIRVINYEIKEALELNLAYMPFITNGGLFIASFDTFNLGEQVLIDLLLPGKKETVKIEGKVVWITPSNALHHVLPGVGIQFTGNNALSTRALIEANLDKLMEVGGYTYGITEGPKKEK